MMKEIVTCLVIGVIGYTMPANAQGCSDAGFCTIGNLNHETSVSQTNYKHSLKITLPTGIGDEEVFVFAPGIEYSYQQNNWQFAGKITANYASGNLGNAGGPGDIFLSATYQIPASSKLITSITLGTKLPMNQGNLKENGLSLPMQYQSSLGTVDLIAGVAVSKEKWKIVAGLQQPLSGTNRNNFLPQYWPNGTATAYPPTNDFKRKGDVLLRTSYRFLTKSKWNLEGSLLGIYHLGEDTYINANISNKQISLVGSQGLTLNLTASMEIMLSPRWSLGLVAGAPLIVRDIRPDGLTRSFVISPQITYQF
jgi:hypothetical protein